MKPDTASESLVAPQRQVLLAAAILAITLLAYIPAMRGGFSGTTTPSSRTTADPGAGRPPAVLADDGGGGLFPAHLQHALGRVAALGRSSGRVPRDQRAAPCRSRGAALAGAAAARRSRRVAGGRALRRSPGGRGVGGVDHGTQEHAAHGALSPVAPGLSPLRRARTTRRAYHLSILCVPARAAGEDLRRHAAGGAAAVRLVAAGKDLSKGPPAQPAVLRAVARPGAGDGLVPAAQRHPARSSARRAWPRALRRRDGSSGSTSSSSSCPRASAPSIRAGT